MPDLTPDIGAFVSIEKKELQRVFDALKEQGYTLAGPTLGEGAIIYDEIERVEDLPIGWTDRQEPGSYKLQRRNDNAYFGYVVGPQSWKQFLFPPKAALMTVHEQNGTFSMERQRRGCASLRPHRCAGLRTASDPYPGSRFSGWALCRWTLQGATAADFCAGGQLHRTGRHLFLQVDGDRT